MDRGGVPEAVVAEACIRGTTSRQTSRQVRSHLALLGSEVRDLGTDPGLLKCEHRFTPLELEPNPACRAGVVEVNGIVRPTAQRTAASSLAVACVELVPAWRA